MDYTSIFGPSLVELLQTVVTLLDTLLNVSNLTNHPFPDIFGLNLICRVCIAYILVAAILASGGMAKIICRLFLRFLNHKIFSIEQIESLKEQTKSLKVEKGQLNEDTIIDDLLTKILQFAGSGGLLIFLTYIFGSKDTQDNISDVLTTITEIVETATLLSEVSGNPSIGFFSKFLYIVLSLFIMAVYTTIGIMLIILIQIMWEKRDDISNWVKERRKHLWTAVSAILLASAIFAAITILGRELQDSGLLLNDFSNTPQVLFKLTAYFALAFLAAAVVLWWCHNAVEIRRKMW